VIAFEAGFSLLRLRVELLHRRSRSQQLVSVVGEAMAIAAVPVGRQRSIAQVLELVHFHFL